MNPQQRNAIGPAAFGRRAQPEASSRPTQVAPPTPPASRAGSMGGAVVSTVRVKLVAKLLGIALLVSASGCESAIDTVDVRDSIQAWNDSREAPPATENAD